MLQKYLFEATSKEGYVRTCRAARDSDESLTNLTLVQHSLNVRLLYLATDFWIVH